MCHFKHAGHLWAFLMQPIWGQTSSSFELAAIVETSSPRWRIHRHSRSQKIIWVQAGWHLPGHSWWWCWASWFLVHTPHPCQHSRTPRYLIVPVLVCTCRPPQHSWGRGLLKLAVLEHACHSPQSPRGRVLAILEHAGHSPQSPRGSAILVGACCYSYGRVTVRRVNVYLRHLVSDNRCHTARA